MTQEQSDRTNSRQVIPPNNDNNNTAPNVSDPDSASAGDTGSVAELVAVAAVAELGEVYREVEHLDGMLRRTRRVYADLVAACRAALAADADGEPDPLSYVRDELPDAPPGHPLNTSGGGR